jgi:hypothetical protein
LSAQKEGNTLLLVRVLPAFPASIHKPDACFHAWCQTENPKNVRMPLPGFPPFQMFLQLHQPYKSILT